MKRIAIVLGLSIAFMASGFAHAKEIKADIKLFQFQPKAIEAKVGDTITWTNGDDIEHSVTAGAPGNETGAFDSGFFIKNGTYAFTFKEAGTYEFFCKKEIQLEKMTGIPFKFRLGSVQQCNRLEGYPNAR